MTKEKNIQANKILAEIQFLEIQISKIYYTLKDNYKERESYLKWDGEEPIIIPSSLFKVINKLILSNYQQKLSELNKEFENL